MKFSFVWHRARYWAAALVVATPLAWSQTFSGLSLINADTNQAISGYSPMAANTTIDLATLPTRRLNIRADVAGTVGSVVFKQGSTVVRTEGTAPYAMYGDNSGDYLVWTPAVGSYAISATLYPQANGQGTAGATKSIQLTVTDSGGGSVAISPASGDPIKQSGRYFVRGTQPVFIVGAGGPEGFLYENDARKQAIVDTLKTNGTNGIYFHAMRAYGGDGLNNGNEHPFTSSSAGNSNKVIDNTKLQQWATYLDQLDQAGIVMWFALFDDHSNPFGCFSSSNQAQYESYANSIVNAFKGYKNIIWVTQEEWNWTNGGCNTTSNNNRQVAIAAAIRAADSVHPIAVHHMAGTTFQFSGDANIGVYGQQSGSGNGPASMNSVATMHSKAAKTGYDSGTAYVMAESHPYHKNLIRDGKDTEMRQSLWAIALGGATGMYVYDMFECHQSGNYATGAYLCSGPNAGVDEAKPTQTMLDDMKRLKEFMNSTKFDKMTPLFGTPLSNTVRGGTQWMMQNTTDGLYMLYSLSNPSNLGVKSVAAGTYNYRWFDPKDGSSNTGTVNHPGGDLTLSKPSGIGTEAVVYISK